jgi:UDP-glucose 4-epimerase
VIKNYLITGGAGFIGSHFLESILDNTETEKVVVFDNLSTGKTENIPNDKRIEFVKGDVGDNDAIERIFKNNKFDYIIHLAAIASVQDSIDHPVLAHKVNFDATLTLLECARKQGGVKRFVFASSAAVYGDKPDLPCRESSMVNPISPYGIDKYASERFVVSYTQLFGVPSTAFRFFNVYGPRQNPSSSYSGVISIFADRILHQGGTIVIFGDGEQTRDFVFVKDLVSVIQFAIQTEKAIGEVYNIGTGKQTSLNELAGVCSDVSGKNISIEYKESRIGDIKHSVSDISKLRATGYDASFSDISIGLKELFKSLQ